MAYRILSLGVDPVLMPVRSMLLRQAGYEVVEARSWQESLNLLRSVAFDLLVICHTVPADLREALIEVILPLRPRLKLLCLQPEIDHDFHDCPSAHSTAPQFLVDVNKAMRVVTRT